MKTLYLVRHGETLFNQLYKIQGWCDSPLTEKGIEQADAVGKYFEDQKIVFDYAYTSTSERAIDTLVHIIDIPYTSYKELKEMNYGLFEGESNRLTDQLTPKECETFFVPYQGESSNDVMKRMHEMLTNIMNREDHNTVLCVSHGGAIFNFLRMVDIKDGLINKGYGNCTIYVLDYEKGKFILKDILPGGSYTKD